MKKLILRYLLTTVMLQIIIGLLIFGMLSKKNIIKKSSASDHSALITTQEDWQVQSADANIDLDISPGSVKLTKSGEGYESGGTWNCDFAVAGCPDNAHDLNTDSFATLAITGGPTFPTYFVHEYGSIQHIVRIKSWMVRPVVAPSAQYYIQYFDGNDWMTIYDNNPPSNLPASTWDIQDLEVDINTTAVRTIIFDSDTMIEIHELQEYSPIYNSPGIITSAATQITDTNLYQWQMFTPTYTTPSNTSINFNLRTSTDGATWTDWTADQTVSSGSPLDITSLVTSSTGDPGSETFYKYIQVKSTLTSTDGVSTPTLSDYTIGYHTNVKPNKPTAQSVTIGS